MDKDATIVGALGVVYATEPSNLSVHIIELLNAEEEGRLFFAPCAIGDTIYAVEETLGLEDDGARIASGRVYSISFSSRLSKIKVLTTIEFMTADHNRTHISHAVYGCDFGETWFLTREEAEAALAKMKE